MREKTKAGDRVVSAAQARALAAEGIEVRGQWHFLFRDPDGNYIGEDFIDNLVVNEGLDHLLSVTLAGGTQDSTWFLGLTDSVPTPAAGDTMASHAGWAEVTNYDEAARPAWTAGAVSGQSVDNSGSPATFTVSAGGVTIGGAFLVADNTKGGTTGILYAIGAFTNGDQTLSEGSTVDVTATFTTAAA